MQRPIVVASRNADVRSRCLLAISGQAAHLITTAELGKGRIPDGLRGEALLVVDEAMLSPQRSDHSAELEAHGWGRETLILSAVACDQMIVAAEGHHYLSPAFTGPELLAALHQLL